MASPAVTYTFANSTTADATQVNQNFTDIINGLTDGTKDLSISALTCAGTATFNGNVAIGNASSDTLTITAVLGSSLALGTTFSYDIGAATVGLRSLYLGASDSAARTVRVLAGAVSASYSITLPTAAPSVSNSVMALTSAGVGTFEPKSTRAVTSKTTTYTATLADDVILVDGSGAAWTLSLPAAASSTGKVLQVVRTDNTPANAVTIDGNASETIQGATTRALYTQYESVTIVCDGSNWQVLDHRCDTADASVTLTPSAGFGTVSLESYWVCRIGDKARFRGYLKTGTVAASEANFTLPSGYVIDSAKFASTASVQRIGLWTSIATSGTPRNISSADNEATTFYDGSTTSKVYFAVASASNVLSKANANILAVNNDGFTFDFVVPISGWWA